MNQSDPVKEFIHDVLAKLEGHVGDAVVIISLILMALAVRKKMYRVSIGFFILALGMVLIRFSINLLF